MIALKVKRKQQAVYFLENEEKRENFELILEFYNVKEPKVNDYLIIHQDLLDRNNENFTQPYAFELCTDKTFDDVKKLSSMGYAILISNNEKFVLKRIYG